MGSERVVFKAECVEVMNEEGNPEVTMRTNFPPNTSFGEAVEAVGQCVSGLIQTGIKLCAAKGYTAEQAMSLMGLDEQ